MLISEIKPIGDRGINFLNIDSSEKTIDRMVELPLKNACKIFKRKCIETVMSSANQNNLLQQGEIPFEKEDLLKVQEPGVRPSYEMAGKGYAWIMLNFDTLSDENKKWLFSLEEKKNENEEKVGEKAIWFAHPYSLPKHLQKSEEFEKRSVLLTYHDGLYPKSVAILRMPLKEGSTVEEVDEYFSKLAESFKDQTRDKRKEDIEFFKL